MYLLLAHSVVSFHGVLPIFCLFADLLLVHYSALCVLCISYMLSILSVTMYILINLVPL